MERRLQLHQILKDITENVYFQPPENVKLKFPCIIYQRTAIDTIHSSNKPYTHFTGYTVTVIDRNPDSLIPSEVAKLPKSRFNTHFTRDNLNHDVYTLYY